MRATAKLRSISSACSESIGKHLRVELAKAVSEPSPKGDDGLGGRAKSVKVEELTTKSLKKVIFENVVLDSTLNTNEAQHYKEIGKEFTKHESVNHSKGEYARGDASTNHVEGFFSIFKRGMTGTYQHCSEKHLQRYLHESNRVALGVDDGERTSRAIAAANGKRLTYRRINCGEAA